MHYYAYFNICETKIFSTIPFKLFFTQIKKNQTLLYHFIDKNSKTSKTTIIFLFLAIKVSWTFKTLKKIKKATARSIRLFFPRKIFTSSFNYVASLFSSLYIARKSRRGKTWTRNIEFRTFALAPAKNGEIFPIETSRARNTMCTVDWCSLKAFVYLMKTQAKNIQLT